MYNTCLCEFRYLSIYILFAVRYHTANRGTDSDTTRPRAHAPAYHPRAYYFGLFTPVSIEDEADEEIAFILIHKTFHGSGRLLLGSCVIAVIGCDACVASCVCACVLTCVHAGDTRVHVHAAVWYRCLCPCSQCGTAVCAPIRSVVSLSVPLFAVWYRCPCPSSQCGIAIRAPVRSVVSLSVSLFAVHAVGRRNGVSTFGQNTHTAPRLALLEHHGRRERTREGET